MKAQVKSVDSVEYLRRGVDGSAGVGKVQKSKKEEKESKQIKAYLNKLQELVPFTPKNKKLSNLEVISYVIDYIQDLREELGLPPTPCQNGSDDLDEQFAWMLMNPSFTSSSAVHDDDLSPAETAMPTSSSATTLTAATITVTSSVNDSTSEHFQHVSRQPLCVISPPGENSQSAPSHLTTSTHSVKSSLVLTSASTNCGH